MSDWYSNYWKFLKVEIHRAWPEIKPGQLFSDSSLERRDWINLLNAKQLTGAWCVVQMAIAQTSAWGLGAPRYRIDSKINYITPTSVAAGLTGVDALPETIEEYLTTRLIVLQAAMTSAGTLGTVLPEFPMEINANEDINRVLLDAKIPFQSSCLTVSSIVLGVSF